SIRACIRISRISSSAIFGSSAMILSAASSTRLKNSIAEEAIGEGFKAFIGVCAPAAMLIDLPFNSLSEFGEFLRLLFHKPLPVRADSFILQAPMPHVVARRRGDLREVIKLGHWHPEQNVIGNFRLFLVDLRPSFAEFHKYKCQTNRHAA